MSNFGKNNVNSGSTSNLFRSQSLASLGGDKLVLGEGFRNSYTLRAHKSAVLKELGLNSKSISRIPKTPRPKRTLDVFTAVIEGLRFVFSNKNHSFEVSFHCYLIISSTILIH